jgi:cysteine dioxygenase
MPKHPVSIDTLVERLRAAESGAVSSSRISEVLLENPLDGASLRPFRRFADDHYTRNLILRDAWFDIMVLCWKPGQGTPIHTHNGQLGWALVTEGALECVEYRWKGCSSPENQNVAGLDCLAGGREVQLERSQELVATPGGALNRVDKQVTIHSLAVPHDLSENVVSLHVYSLPFDSCVVCRCAGVRPSSPWR